MPKRILQVQVDPIGNHVLFLRYMLSSHAYHNPTKASLERLRRAILNRLHRNQLELVWMWQFPFVTTFKRPIPKGDGPEEEQ